MRALAGRITAALLVVAFAIAFGIVVTPACAAEHLDGAGIPLYEALPFAGLLLSIALGPIFAKRLWHVHYGSAAAAWAVLALSFWL